MKMGKKCKNCIHKRVCKFGSEYDFIGNCKSYKLILQGNNDAGTR